MVQISVGISLILFFLAILYFLATRIEEQVVIWRDAQVLRRLTADALHAPLISKRDLDPRTFIAPRCMRKMRGFQPALKEFVTRYNVAGENMQTKFFDVKDMADNAFACLLEYNATAKSAAAAQLHKDKKGAVEHHTIGGFSFFQVLGSRYSDDDIAQTKVLSHSLNVMETYVDTCNLVLSDDVLRNCAESTISGRYTEAYDIVNQIVESGEGEENVQKIHDAYDVVNAKVTSAEPYISTLDGLGADLNLIDVCIPQLIA